MRLFLDMTRVTTRIYRGGPTGIERVEYAYIKHKIDDPDTTCVFTAPLLSGAISKARARDIVRRVERAWRINATAEEDDIYRALKHWLDHPPNNHALHPPRFQRKNLWAERLQDADFFPLLDILRAKDELKRTVVGGGMYFHASHVQLDRPARFRWLQHHNVQSTMFLHDAIPIEYPEFCSPGGAERHLRRLRTVCDLSQLILVNSQETRRAVEQTIRQNALRTVPIEVVPLAVGQAFLNTRPQQPQGTPYFLYVGTIEPRKNLLFLLGLWRELIHRHGPATPRLIIAGRRGWENENILDLLQRSRTLAPYVAEASGLTDAGLARLMSEAAGLVAPSLTEGFDLPIVEALTVGTPVVASDIPAHREVGQDFVTLAHPLDGPAWLAAVETLLDPPLSQQQRAHIATYTPFTWAQHVAQACHLMQKACPLARPAAR